MRKGAEAQREHASACVWWSSEVVRGEARKTAWRGGNEEAGRGCGGREGDVEAGRQRGGREGGVEAGRQRGGWESYLGRGHKEASVRMGAEGA